VATRRRDERLTELVTRLDKAGHCALALPSDVTDKAAARRMIARIADRYGPVEILVNTVARPGPGADTEQCRRMIHTIRPGPVYAAHAVLPSMVQRSSDDILYVSSVAERTTRACSAVYTAAQSWLASYRTN
jgi:NADP-dependent 3-hydroxy acid dehydrogenase YdfG